MSNIKWGRVIVGIILAFIVAIAIPVLYVTVRMFIIGFQIGGAPPRETQIELSTNTAYAVVALLATVLGGFLGGRIPARMAEGGHVFNGLAVGIGLAIVIALFAVFQSGAFSLWTLLHAAVAVAAGALGGWIGGRRAEAEDMYD